MTWSSWWGHASWCGALEQLVATIARAARATPVVVLLFMTERIRRGCPVVVADTLAVWDHSVSPPLRGAMSPNKARCCRSGFLLPPARGDRLRLQSEACGRVTKDSFPGSWYTACSAGCMKVAVATGSPVPRLRA